MNIEVDSSGVDNVYNLLSDKTDDFSQEIKKLSNIVNNVGSAWQGDDATKYTEAMKTYIEALNAVAEMMGQCNKYLCKVPGFYETLDEAYANKKINY